MLLFLIDEMNKCCGDGDYKQLVLTQPGDLAKVSLSSKFSLRPEARAFIQRTFYSDSTLLKNKRYKDKINMCN